MSFNATGVSALRLQVDRFKLCGNRCDTGINGLIGLRIGNSYALAAMPIDVTPSSANFILFRPTGMGGRELWQALLDRSVLVRDCSGWPRLADCLRITIGTPDENDAFLTALEEILR